MRRPALLVAFAILTGCAKPAERPRPPPLPERDPAAVDEAPPAVDPPRVAEPEPPPVAPPAPPPPPTPSVRDLFARLRPTPKRADACPSRCVVIAEPAKKPGAPETALVVWVHRGRFPDKVVALLVHGADGWVAFELGRLGPFGTIDEVPRADRVRHALTTATSPPRVQLHLELLTQDHTLLPVRGLRDVSCEVPEKGPVRCQETLQPREEG